MGRPTLYSLHEIGHDQVATALLPGRSQCGSKSELLETRRHRLVLVCRHAHPLSSCHLSRPSVPPRALRCCNSLTCCHALARSLLTGLCTRWLLTLSAATAALASLYASIVSPSHVAHCPAYCHILGARDTCPVDRIGATLRGLHLDLDAGIHRLFGHVRQDLRLTLLSAVGATKCQRSRTRCSSSAAVPALAVVRC